MRVNEAVPEKGWRGLTGAAALAGLMCCAGALGAPPFEYPPFDMNVGPLCTTLSFSGEKIPSGKYVEYTMTIQWSTPDFSGSNSNGATWSLVDRPGGFFGCPFDALVYASPGVGNGARPDRTPVELTWRGTLARPYFGGTPLHLAFSQVGITGNWARVTFVLHPEACNLADVCGIGGLDSPPDGILTGDDFVAFIEEFARGGAKADVCGIGGASTPPDGRVTPDDFSAFIDAFAAGCP